MRDALLMFTACFTGALIFIGVLFGIMTAAWALGGPEWIEHAGEDHWQTWVYMMSTAAISGLTMLPVFKFWERRILK
jgi:hypothetical protein